MEARRFAYQPGDGSPALVFDEFNGYSVEADTTRGLFGGAFRIGTTVLPGVPGVQVDSIVPDATEPQIGLLVQADNDDDFQRRIRDLVSRMLPTRGLGRLLVTTERTGETRALPCYATGEGLEGSEEDDTLMPGRWWKCIVRLLASDGMWRGQEITYGWELDPPTPSPWFPMMQARISSRSVGGRRRLLNPGEHEVFPPWRIKGPASEVALIHHDLGREFRIVHDIPALGLDSVVTIDMGRGRQRVADGYAPPGESNLFSKVASDPEGWPLLPGWNDVEVQVIDGGEGTSVSLTFEPLHASS